MQNSETGKNGEMAPPYRREPNRPVIARHIILDIWIACPSPEVPKQTYTVPMHHF